MTGVNLDALNPKGIPSPDVLKRLGFEWVRLVAREHEAFYLYHDWCQREGLKTLVLFALESFGNVEWHSSIARTILRRIRPDKIQVCNEPDGEGESSWKMHPWDYMVEVYEIRAVVEQENLRIPVIGAGLCSGRPDWLSEIASLHEGITVCVHPYGKSPEQARELIQAYKRMIPNTAVEVTEWNRPVHEITSMVQMLREETEGFHWFCWSDGMVPPYGLVNADAIAKEELIQLSSVLKEGMPDMAEFILGFKDLAEKLGEEVVGQPVEDEHYWPDGSTSMQATTKGFMIYSKEGNLAQFHAAVPVPDPKS